MKDEVIYKVPDLASFAHKTIITHSVATPNMSSLQGADQSYEEKLEKLQRYLPFLRKMITKLERTNDPGRTAQLQKMRHLHAILTDSSRKLKYELLAKCEGVLQKLHDKIEGESDDDIMELPQPALSQRSRPPPSLPPAELPRRLLYPESEWERPSPPRETPISAPGSSSTSRVSDDLTTHSPPLSSFVERISMSSPSTSFNDMDQPRSPSPEVVAQIPGAFTGSDHKDKKFERGREILRKLMVGMSKTLEETEVESPPDMASAARGPKIIPLERESSNDTPDAEIPADSIEAAGSSSCAADPQSSATSKPTENVDAYNPEDEWSEIRKKPAFRPSFMSRPPLSKEDLEELNRDLGAGSTHSSTSGERREASSSSSKSRHKSSEPSSRKHSSPDGRDEKEKDRRERHRSHEKKLEIRKGETQADAKRRHFEEWKKAEIEKRKKQKAEMKQSSHGKSRHDSSRPSSSHHRKGHSQNYSSSRKPGRDASMESSGATPDRAKDRVGGKPSPVDITGDDRAESFSKDPRTKARSMNDLRKASDERSDKGGDSLKKPDATLEKVSEQLKKYSVQELVKTVHESMSPVSRKKELPDDLEQTFRCLVIRNLPPNTLRQDIFRLFHGFGIVELVLEVHFSFTCAGIAYAQLAEHSEAKRARRELADKMVHGSPVKIAPCADGIFREAKRTYEQTMNAREEQYAKRQGSQSQPTPLLAGTQFSHQSHASGGYRQQYPSHSPGVPPLRPSSVPPAGVGGAPKPGLLGYAPPQAVGHFRAQSSRFPSFSATSRASTPPRQSLGKHNFNNPYNVQPGKGDNTMPSKNDPRRAAQMLYHEQKRQQLEKELEILKRHKGEKEKPKEREKGKEKEKPPQKMRPDSHGKPAAMIDRKSVTEHKPASLGKFKIPKLKKSGPPVNESPEAASDPSLPSIQSKKPVSCHQEDTVSSTVNTEDLVVRQKRKRSRIVVISDSDSEPEVCKSDEVSTRRSKKSGAYHQDRHKEGSVGAEHSKETKDIKRRQSESSSSEGKRTVEPTSSRDKKTISDTKSTIGSESDACENVESDTDRTDAGPPPAANAVRTLDKEPMVVLTRAHAKTALDAHRTEKKTVDCSRSKLPQEVDLAKEVADAGSSEAGVTVSSVEEKAETADDRVTDHPQRDKAKNVSSEVAKQEDRDSKESNLVAAVIATSEDAPSSVVKAETEAIEPEECEYCSFSGKKIIPHYVGSHPGKPISVKMQAGMMEVAVQEELGPGDDSAKRSLEKDLEEKLLNDDLSWIPPSLMFEYSIACLYCKFTALNKRHMLQHIADHLQTGTSAPDTYSMKCRFCKVRGVNAHEMFDHISSHTGEYRYSCPHCGFKVFRMYYLKRHIMHVHKGSPLDEVAIEEADIGNGWMYGYVCKLCGYVQLHERNVKKHMDDVHGGSTEYTKINMCTRGPAMDISKKVNDAHKRKKVDDEKRAAAMPPRIEDMSVFEVGEHWLKQRSLEETSRKADMNALVARYSKKLTVPDGQTGGNLLQKLEGLQETPMQYLKEMRQRALEKPSKLEDPADQDGEQDQSQEPEQDAKKNDDDSDGADSEPPWDRDAEEADEAELPPLGDLLSELHSIRSDSASEFGYQVTVKLAESLRQSVGEPELPTAGLSGVAIKEEPADPFSISAESDARTDAGLNSMNDDLESLMNDFDEFEREQGPPKPKLRIRKLSGDLLSDDPLGGGLGGGGLGGLMISSVMSLTGGTEPDPLLADAAAKKADDLFAFPPEGERRPWKYFLTLKDQSKVMRLMFHMHHKSAYKCNAVHCSLTTNNGTLFKLHLRNHEKCDVCTPDENAYTCMNTRLVCVYCGYKGTDLAEHVYKRHAVSQFQCGYCFYRTRQNAYMHEHQRRWHADMPTYFLQSDPANPPPGLNASHLVETEMVGESSLTPYICAQDGCDRAAIKAAALEQHYLDAHPDATVFPCHVCGLRAPSFGALVGHYISHGYVAYHCAYCSYANQDQNDVKKHLIDFHPDDPPKCYARIPKSMNVVLGSTSAASAAPPPVPALPAASVKQEPGSPAAPSSPSAGASTALTVKQEHQESERPASETQVVLEEAGDSAAQPPRPSAPPGEPSGEPAPLLAEDLYRCGNPKCSERFPTLPSFKDHLLSCYHGENGVLLCFHCPKQVKHVSTALEHVRLHGPRRYSCALCDFNAPVPSYVTKHLKQQHRMSSCTTLPLLAERADPERDQFVVYPRQCVPRAEQPPAASGTEQSGFGVEDIDQLPHRPVLFRSIQCKLCPYSSKVTRNLLKHLLCHKRSDGTAPLPVAAPSNPRPCDQRGEKMFDQMANLASGSGEVGVPRKAAELSQADLERLPKEVTEDKRYICSIPGCVYLTLNDTMLKYHIQALHGQMITYPCPHCKDLYMIPDKLSAHLRLHGPRLYKCKYCIYNHYQRSLVTRHVRDKHPMLPLVDVAVREPDDDEAARPLFKPWRCGLCKYQALLQPEVVEHVSAVHDLRSQFKCGLCSMRSSVRSAFDLHFASKHPGESVSVFAIYYKLDAADAEAAVKAEHCQPIWQRNNPRRIRHVRGILIEEVKVVRGSPVKRRVSTSQRSPIKKPAVAAATAEKRVCRNSSKGAAGQARRRAIKRALRQTTSGRLRQRAASGPEPEPEEHQLKPDPKPERPPDPDPLSPDDQRSMKPIGPKSEPATEDEFLSLFETKSCELGPKGDADVLTKQFVCPRCNKYKTKRKRDFSMHLYKELGYNRFVCGNCGHMNTSMPNMKRHHEMMHKVARLPEAIVPLTPDSAQEEWIEAVLDHQERQIGGKPLTDEQPQQTKQEVETEPKPGVESTPKLEDKPESKPAAAETEPKSETELEPRSTVSRPALPVESPFAPVYKCWYCDERGTIPVLSGHWKSQHSNMRFRIIKQIQRFACNHCSFQSARTFGIRTHLTEKHPGVPMTDFTIRAHDRQTRFKCGWCKDRFLTRAKAEAHHGVFHAHLEPKVETYTARSAKEAAAPASASSGSTQPTAAGDGVARPSVGGAEISTGPAVPEAGSSASPAATAPDVVRCPLCSYSGPKTSHVYTHLLSHYKRYKCETCGYVDGVRMVVVRHHRKKHPGEPERVVLLEHLDQEFKQMKRTVRDQASQGGSTVTRGASPARSDVTTGSRGSRGTKRSADGVSPARKRPGPASMTGVKATRPSHGGVARKSTAAARAGRAAERGRVGRGVALKSTGGARRFAAPYSFYGTRAPPIGSYSEVTTQLTLGGATSMRVNVPTLAQIVKLYPRCLVVDLRQKKLAL